MSSPNFAITRGSGFHITFDNGYSVSVQFGPTSHTDNGEGNDDPFERIGAWGIDYPQYGKKGCANAECGVLDPDGKLIDLPKWAAENDQVTNRSTPAQVLRLMNWASKIKGGVK